MNSRYSWHININNLLYIGGYFNIDLKFEMFFRGKDNGHDTWKMLISKYFPSVFSVTYVVGTHWNCLH